jgi:hypothetical protein
MEKKLSAGNVQSLHITLNSFRGLCRCCVDSQWRGDRGAEFLNREWTRTDANPNPFFTADQQMDTDLDRLWDGLYAPTDCGRENVGA